jgi:hypothetical protein
MAQRRNDYDFGKEFSGLAMRVGNSIPGHFITFSISAF